MVDFASMVEKAAKAKPDSVETRYLSLRLALYANEIDEATELAARLSWRSLEKGAIPLENHDLESLALQLPYYHELLTMPAADFGPEVDVLVGPSKENLTPIPIGQVDDRPGYRLPVGSYYRFRFNNAASHPIHVYLHRIDTAGRLRFMTLWHETKLLMGGLQPGETILSFTFGTGEPGVNQLYFIASPEMLPQILAPPEMATRGGGPELELPSGVTTLRLLHVVMSRGIVASG